MALTCLKGRTLGLPWHLVATETRSHWRSRIPSSRQGILQGGWARKGEGPAGLGRGFCARTQRLLLSLSEGLGRALPMFSAHSVVHIFSRGRGSGYSVHQPGWGCWVGAVIWGLRNAAPHCLGPQQPQPMLAGQGARAGWWGREGSPWLLPMNSSEAGGHGGVLEHSRVSFPGGGGGVAKWGRLLLSLSPP